MWCEWGSARLEEESTEPRWRLGGRPGLATVWRRRTGAGENTGYDSSGLCARPTSSDDGGDSNEMRRGSRYASRDTVISADDGDGGPGGAGGAGRARGAAAGARTGDEGADGSLRGVWKPRGEAGGVGEGDGEAEGEAGVWYPCRDSVESPRTSGACSDPPACVSSSSSSFITIA